MAYGTRPSPQFNWPHFEKVTNVEQPDYPVADPIFIERLRLALARPESIQRPSRIASIVDDMQLTIRLLIRRYVMHGGAYKLASLGKKVRPELADEVMGADAADRCITGLFAKK